MCRLRSTLKLLRARFALNFYSLAFDTNFEKYVVHNLTQHAVSKSVSVPKDFDKKLGARDLILDS